MKKLILGMVFFVFVFPPFCSLVYGEWESFDYHAYSDDDIATEYQNILADNKLGSDMTGISDMATYRDAAGEEALPEEKKAAVGADVSIRKNIKKYTLPLSYGTPVRFLNGDREFLNFSLKIPYAKREIGTNKDSGLGDIKFSADYLARFSNLLVNTVVLLKLPTGDFDDADVPLGTGSTDYGVAFNGKWYLDNFSLLGGVGYVLTGDFSKSGTKVEYGDEMFVSGGAEYNISADMFAGAQLIYQIKEENKYTYPTFNNNTPGLNTLDLAPSFTYLLRKFDLEMTAKVVIPVADSWNGGDGPDPKDPDRDMEFKFLATRPF